MLISCVLTKGENIIPLLYTDMLSIWATLVKLIIFVNFTTILRVISSMLFLNTFYDL